MVLEKEIILSISCWIYLGITHNLFKEESENTKSVNRRRMDNPMTKSKRTKEKIMIYKTLPKEKDRATRTPLETGGELGSSRSSCSTSDTRLVIIVTMPDWRLISWLSYIQRGNTHTQGSCREMWLMVVVESMCECCLMPTQQFSSCIMARTSLFSLRWRCGGNRGYLPLSHT